MYRICRVARAVGLGALAALAGCAPDAPVRPAKAPSFDVAAASRPAFVFPAGCCYYQGHIVRTVVPPASAARAPSPTARATRQILYIVSPPRHVGARATARRHRRRAPASY